MKLTRDDVVKKQTRIEDYKKQLNELRQAGYDTGDKEHIGFGFFYVGQGFYNEQEQLLLSLIKGEQNELDHAEIVDGLENADNIVVMGDYVTMLLEYAGEEPKEATMLISDEIVDGELCISSSSPIGMAIYGKEVGSIVKCITPRAMLTITILKKTHGRLR